MKKTIKYGLLVLILTASIIGFAFNVPIQADSGWDSSYDSGSSSSDFGSSSDYDSSSSSGSHSSSRGSGNSSSDEETLFFGIFLVAFVAAIVIGLIRSNNYYKKIREEIQEDKEKAKAELEAKIKNYLPNYSEEKLKEIFSQMFIDIQFAWMNFDYEQLRKLCSDELYSTYKSELEDLEKQNGQNIMGNFIIKDFSILEIKENNSRISVTVKMHAEFYDYVINTETKEITHGTKDNYVHNYYELIYIIDKEIIDNKCPNCGAELNNGKCDYCNSVIASQYKSFVLSNKKKLN